MKKNRSTVTLKADIPVYGGSCLSRYGGKVVLIDGAVIPGETVEAAIEKEKKDYIEASVVRVLEPSPFRTRPACRYFGSCGGCHLQYMSYERQVQVKEEVLRDCFKRIAKCETGLSEPLTDKNPWHYRVRGQFKVSNGKIGLYRAKTREVVDIENCPLMADEINTDLQKARLLLKGIDVREVHISRGNCSVALLRDPVGLRSSADRDSLAWRFMEAGFSGLSIQSSDRRLQHYGEQFITLRLEGLRYTISAMSFLQSHWRLNQTVVAFIKEKLLSAAGGRILDLYAGAGNFTLPLADTCEVTAVEENGNAVGDGVRNVEINDLKNYRFIHSSAEDFQMRDSYNTVLLDPPRPGLSNTVVNSILASMPERIVYVSCDPSTLARDVRKLSGRYAVESVRLIDFFPHTFHIESLAFLVRT